MNIDYHINMIHAQLANCGPCVMIECNIISSVYSIIGWWSKIHVSVLTWHGI